MDFRRTVWAALLTLPVFVGEMGGHIYPPIPAFVNSLIGMERWALMSFLLISAVMIWPGRAFYTIGLRALLKGAPEMNSLVAPKTHAHQLTLNPKILNSFFIIKYVVRY